MNVNGGKQSVRELLQDCFVQTNAALESFERKILVRRMSAAIGERKSHEQRFDAENFTELGDDRYAAALAYQGGVAAECLAQRALCRFAHRRVRVSEIPRPAMAGGNFHNDAFGQIFLQMRFR